MHNDESLSRYDPVAGWYDSFVRGVANAGNFVLSVLFELAGDLRVRARRRQSANWRLQKLTQS